MGVTDQLSVWQGSCSPWLSCPVFFWWLLLFPSTLLLYLELGSTTEMLAVPQTSPLLNRTLAGLDWLPRSSPWEESRMRLRISGDQRTRTASASNMHSLMFFY